MLSGTTDFLSPEHTLHRVIWRASTQEQEAAELLGNTLRSAQHKRVQGGRGSQTQLEISMKHGKTFRFTGYLGYVHTLGVGSDIDDNASTSTKHWQAKQARVQEQYTIYANQR
jgi:hypothetical protein